MNQIGDFLFMDDEPQKADVIFVPGNGYVQMSLLAASLWKEGYAPYILPSGRYSVVQGSFTGPLEQQEKYSGSFETEWEFLRSILLREGVADSAILREDRATFTYENAIYSRQVTDRAGIDVKKAILCCRNIHGRRCKMYYQLLYPDTQFYVCPCDVEGITRSNWQDSEEGIEAVMGEVQRIIKQFSLMMKR